MARKKKHPEHVNHERWLVSYADFITLLFAFFVVMFAVSQVDSKKVGRFTESFSKAIGVDMFPQPGHGLLSGATDGTVAAEDGHGSMLPEELESLKASINQSTTAQIPLQGVQVITKRNELVLRLADNLLFESGNDKLEERARAFVSLLAAELRNRRVDIRVEGHTDDRPIRTARFRSNWDLSTARATTIVVRLAAEGIAPTRLSAAGYGEFHPIASNTTEDGRKQNRRVDLVVSLPAPKEEVNAEDANGRAKSETNAAPSASASQQRNGAPGPGAPPAPSSMNRRNDGEPSLRQDDDTPSGAQGAGGVAPPSRMTAPSTNGRMPARADYPNGRPAAVKNLREAPPPRNEKDHP